MTNTDLDTFMENLRRLVSKKDSNELTRHNPFIIASKHQIQLLYDELDYLIGSCFKDQYDLEDVGNNWKTTLVEVAHEAEYIVDMFVSSAIIQHEYVLRLTYQQMTNSRLRYYLADWSLDEGVMKRLKSIRAEMSSNINNNKGNHLFANLVNRQYDKFESTGNTENEEFIVGFEEDGLAIIDRLTGDRKKLDIISIVGMGGLGKTTLATKVFNDSLVEYHFDKRGWATVSQAYSNRDLLVQLLASIGKSVHEAAAESKLCEMLYRSLKRIRYLIIIDDIWSCKAWDDVGLCFPDDNTGSRVLLTTRLTGVALHASMGGFTHNLGHLNDDQSWELLCRKTFRGYECPENLIETGKRIAKSCGGLPLALVVIAGLLEKVEKRKILWEKIAKSVGSYVIKDPKGCLDTLALSYDHLYYIIIRIGDSSSPLFSLSETPEYLLWVNRRRFLATTTGEESSYPAAFNSSVTTSII